MKDFRSTSQLLVCHVDSTKGHALSKQCLPHWLCEGIALCYIQAKQTPLVGIRAHSTSEMVATAALLKGIVVENICIIVLQCPFIRFYLYNPMLSTAQSSCLIASYTGSMR